MKRHFGYLTSMDVYATMESITTALEVVGVIILVAGIAFAFATAALRMSRGTSVTLAYEGLRKSIGRSILLGLEVLVAADLVYTVVVDRTLDSVLGLALIVLVRTLLSFSLEIEIEGTLPWRRNQS